MWRKFRYRSQPGLYALAFRALVSGAAEWGFEHDADKSVGKDAAL